jgi:hypothetical protein
MLSNMRLNSSGILKQELCQPPAGPENPQRGARPRESSRMCPMAAVAAGGGGRQELAAGGQSGKRAAGPVRGAHGTPFARYVL